MKFTERRLPLPAGLRELAAKQDFSQEIEILKRELKHIDRTISDFERLEAKTPANGKPFAQTKKSISGTLVQMKRKSRLF